MNAALILDLKKSRKYSIDERNEIQQYLVKITDALNELFEKRIVRELRFNGGDELQGLFSDPESAFLCLRMLSRTLYRIHYHAGIGIGEWTTVVNERDTFYQDGPVYHRARKAIDLAKKESDYTAMIVSDKECDPVLNAMLNGCYRLISSNSSYQNELAILLECRYPILHDYPFQYGAMSSLLEIIRNNNNITMKQRTHGNDTDIIETNKVINQKVILNESSIVEYIELNQKTDDVFFKNSHPYGAASELAEYTELTRQAVDKALRKANTYTERSLAIAIVKMLRQTEF